MIYCVRGGTTNYGHNNTIALGVDKTSACCSQGASSDAQCRQLDINPKRFLEGMPLELRAGSFERRDNIKSSDVLTSFPRTAATALEAHHP